MRRRTFLSLSLSLAAGSRFAMAFAKGPRLVKIVEFTDSGQRKGVMEVEKVQKAPSARLPANIGITTSTAFTSAFVVKLRYSRQTPSSNRAPVGRVSGRPWPKRMSLSIPT